METTFRLFLSVSATFLPECVSLMMRTVTPADTDTIADCKERHCCENKEKRVLFLSRLKLHKKSCHAGIPIPLGEENAEVFEIVGTEQWKADV